MGGRRVEQEEVNTCLEQYVQNRARCAYLEQRLQDMRGELAYLKAHKVEDLVSVSPGNDGMPHSQNTGDPAGTAAIRLADGYEPGYITELERDIDRLDREHQRLQACLGYVDAWLLALNRQEKFLLEHKYLHQETWRSVSRAFEMEFGYPISLRGLKAAKKRAMQRIYEIAK